jgi:hypothetical protein
MNRSKVWTVLHEAGRWQDMRRPLPEIQRRFNRDHYGEVNGYLVLKIDKLGVEKRGIILRNPADLWLSITTWHSQEKWRRNRLQKWNEDFNRIMTWMPHLLRLAESGRYFVIEFERMVRSQSYLRSILRHFEIDDVKISKKLIETKINASPDVIKRTRLEIFKPRIRDSIKRLTENYLQRTETIFGK